MGQYEMSEIVTERTGTPTVVADPTPSGPARVVTCDLGFVVVDPSEVVLQLAPSRRAGTVTTESLTVTVDGSPCPEPGELDSPYGARLHVVRAQPGLLLVSYRSVVDVTSTGEAATPGPDDATLERLIYLRPSRYCPSDHLVGFAVAEFGYASGAQAKVEAIAGWIRERIGYVAGSSSVHDTAEHTLLTGMGTCRDYAHLGIALCRALGIPARFASAYAPGLTPMDFHAVFEACIDGRWLAYDTTDLAPRQSMLRIGTGRDAADAAFATVTSGIATLVRFDVTATVSGLLPVDDPAEPVALA
jgi:transglutaminase-like putative cysteine protease